MKLRIRHRINQCISWLAAFALSLVIVNILIFPYERPVGWIDRNNGSTSSILRPGSTLIHNKEGHGIYTVDSKGYLNSGMLIDSGYVIAVGASHTAGKEISCGKRYTDLFNDILITECGGGV